MIYALLFAIAVLCTVGSVLTFTTRLRDTPEYPWIMGVLSFANGVLYAWGCRMMPSTQAIVVLGLITDLVMIAAYYVLPMLAFGVRVNPLIIFGGVMVVTGAVFLKLGSG